MKKTFALAASVATALMIVPASAADVNTYENAFNGFYVGVNGGYGWADSEIDYTGAYEAYSLSPIGGGEFSSKPDLQPQGALLGAQVGANFVMQNGLLLGAEVSGDWAAMSDDKNFNDGDVSARVQQDVNALGLAQLKLGWANDNFAIYGLGGLALGQVDTSTKLAWNNAGLSDKISDSHTMTGWTLGAGADYMLSNNISLGVSYNYIDLGDYDQSYDISATSGPFSVLGNVKTNTSVTMQVVKATLNYHF